MKKVMALSLSFVLLFSFISVSATENYVNASGWAVKELTKADKDGFITKNVSDDFSRLITLPRTLEAIEFMGFQDCLSFTEVTIPGSVKTIGDKGFFRCEGLTKVIFLANNLESIGASAFDQCPNVTFLCQVGSVAEAYAIKNNIPVTYPEK